jgi:pSer/pThr/pTyr-binding forkhead associated (FHA) protein
MSGQIISKGEAEMETAQPQSAASSSENSSPSANKLLPVELTIHDHYSREAWFVLNRLPAVLGRDDAADVHLNDPWISHRHCEIDRIGDVLLVRDLDSKNGIFLHGHRVRESHLFPGDRLTLGRTEVTVQYACDPKTVEAIAAAHAARDGGSDSTHHGDRPESPPETIELLY